MAKLPDSIHQQKQALPKRKAGNGLSLVKTGEVMAANAAEIETPRFDNQHQLQKTSNLLQTKSSDKSTKNLMPSIRALILDT